MESKFKHFRKTVVAVQFCSHRSFVATSTPSRLWSFLSPSRKREQIPVYGKKLKRLPNRSHYLSPSRMLYYVDSIIQLLLHFSRRRCQIFWAKSVRRWQKHFHCVASERKVQKVGKRSGCGLDDRVESFSECISGESNLICLFRLKLILKLSFASPSSI